MPGQLENMQCIVSSLKTSSLNVSLHKTQIIPVLEGGIAFPLTMTLEGFCCVCSTSLALVLNFILSFLFVMVSGIANGTENSEEHVSCGSWL